MRRTAGRSVMAALGLVLALGGCSGLLFQPMRQHLATPADFGFDYRDLTLLTDDGVRLHAWSVPAIGDTRGRILVLHGNAENISTHMRSVLWLAGQGYELLSQGTPSLEGVHRDARAGLDWLLEPADAGDPDLFLLGQSLGASIAVAALAADGRAARLSGLILDSAFTGYRDIAREKLAGLWLTWPLQYPLSWTFADEPRPLDAIARLPALPLLLIGGVDDRVVPLHHAEALYAAARSPKTLWRLRGLGHAGGFADASVRERLLDWLQRAGEGRVGPDRVLDLP